MTKFKRNTQNWLYAIVVVLLTFGCSSDKDNENGEQATLSQAELLQILETDDLSGAADDIVTQLFVGNSNGLTGKTDSDCYEAAYTDTGFTVTFTNCNVGGEENVNGTLITTYTSTGDSLSFTTTYENFSVGGIQLSGTRSFSFNGIIEQTAFSFTVTSDMDLVLEDGTAISETGTKTLGFAFGDSLETTTFTIDGNWTVIWGDDTYAVTVDTTLAGNLACGYLTMGVLQIGKNGLVVSVDFGDGSCDDMATVIYPDGTNEDISLED